MSRNYSWGVGAVVISEMIIMKEENQKLQLKFATTQVQGFKVPGSGFKMNKN